MGSIKKLVKASIKDANIEGNPLKDGVATTAKFGPNSVESSEIGDGAVTTDDLASTLNLSSKTVTLPNTSVTAGMLSDTLDLSPKSVTLADTIVNFDREYFNISLLGFKINHLDIDSTVPFNVGYDLTNVVTGRNKKFKNSFTKS